MAALGTKQRWKFVDQGEGSCARQSVNAQEVQLLCALVQIKEQAIVDLTSKPSPTVRKMLPDNLVSVYQQYKEDTNAVASWLASTAKSCGYASDLLSGGSSQATGPERPKRLKGKARKEAKAAAPQPQGSSSSSSRPDYIIAIKDFIPLAEFVAASRKPIVSVPRAFANTLDRVISTRSGFSSRLSELGNSTDISADSKHSHFVGVLEKVREVLKPRVLPPSQARDAASPRTTSDPMGEVGGRFAGLNVYDTSEQFLNAPDIERPVPSKGDTATYVAESPKDLKEVLFAYTLLTNDLNKIRARIEWIWTNYRVGIFELVAAAIATNTACDLARNLTEDMAPMLKTHGGAKQIAKHLYVSECMAKGFAFGEIVKSGNEFNWDNAFNCETYDIANDTYMIVFMILNNFLDILGPPGVLPIYKEGTFQPYDPNMDWGRLSNEVKLEQDRILMTETFTEMLTLVRCVPDYPVYDEFSRGMQELDRTREIPMYLVFAAQIFLDIHHILRGQVYSAHKTCMSHMGLMDEDLALQIDFQDKFRVRKSTASENQMLKDLRKRIKWIQDDPIHKFKVKVSRKSGTPFNAPIHRILKYSPVISGLMLYHFRATTYLLSLKLVNFRGSITFPLHLYTALKHEKILSPQVVPAESWEDMVVVLAILGNDSFYVGSELPKDPEDYFKYLALQMGTTAVAFSNSKHKRMLTSEELLSKGGARSIKDNCAPVSDMFVDRYVTNTGQVEWTPEHVKSIVSRSLHEEIIAEDEGAVLMSQILDPEKLRQRKRNIAAEAAGKKTSAAASARVPPEKLIRSLVLALQVESLTLVFPYLTLHRAAWSVVQAVRDACEPFILDLYDREHSDSECQLPWVVTRVLSTLALGDDTLFVKAGAAVKDQLRQGQGGKATQRLQSMGYKVLRQHGETSTFPPAGTFSVIG